MCNINAVFSRTEDKTLLPLINAMSWYSFKSNSDGDGGLWKRDGELYILKSTGKLIYTEPFEWIITHQRLATSGKVDESMAHPYETKRIILFHNGVFNGLGNGTVSDTYEFTKLLDKATKRVESEKGLIKAVSKAINQATDNGRRSATYSIFFYHKKFGKVYYFRNGRSLYYAVIGDVAVYSTDKDNVEYAIKYLGKEGVKISSPEAKVLYAVSYEGVEKIGKLNIKEREPPFTPIGTYRYYYSYDRYTSWGEETYNIDEHGIEHLVSEVMYYLDRTDNITEGEVEGTLLEFFEEEDLRRDERIWNKLLDRAGYREDAKLYQIILSLWRKYGGSKGNEEKVREVVCNV